MLNPPLFTPPDKFKNNTFTGVDGLQYTYENNMWLISSKAYDKEMIKQIVKKKIGKHNSMADLAKVITFNPYLFPGVYYSVEQTQSHSKYGMIFTSSDLYILTLILCILDFHKMDVFGKCKIKVDKLEVHTLKDNKFFKSILVSDDNELRINLANFYKSQSVFKSADHSAPMLLFILSKLGLLDLTVLFNQIAWKQNRYGAASLSRLSLRKQRISAGENNKIPIPDELIINHVINCLKGKDFVSFASVNKYYRKLLLENDNRQMTNLLYDKFKDDSAFELVMNKHPELIIRCSKEENRKFRGWRDLNLPGSMLAYLSLEYPLSTNDIVYICNVYPDLSELITEVIDKEISAADLDILKTYLEFSVNRL